MSAPVKQALLTLIAMSILAFSCLAVIIGTYSLKPLSVPPDGYVCLYEPGTSLKSLANELATLGIIDKPKKFLILARLKAVSKRMQAGEYLLTEQMNINDLIDTLSSGKTMQHDFTIIEGWTNAQLIAAIKQDDTLNHSMDLSNTNDLITAFSINHNNGEGLFYPDTYSHPRNYSDKALLGKAHEQMNQFMEQQWQQRDTNTPYDSPYQALIAASLIEKETALDEERPVIASVIINRLNKNMPLQIDPTVIYGLGDRYQGKLTRSDLAKQSPYNTYTNKGLPPTPIAIPSTASIIAALNPAKTEYLYFVATGDGSHEFTSNLADHEKAVTAYRAQLTNK